MRHRCSEPNADCSVHHLPETQQRRGRAGLLPNGESARAVASGATTPMPRRNTLVAHRNGKKVGLIIEMGRIARLLAAVAHSPARIGPSSPSRGAKFSRSASIPAAKVDKDGAGEEEAELDRREVQRFDE